MSDEKRLRDLISLGGDRAGWAKNTRQGIYYSARNLMSFLGGYDAMVFATRERVNEWLKTKLLNSPSTAYGHKLRICHVYDILVDEGIIDDNPATAAMVPVPLTKKPHSKPAMDLKDVRKLFSLARRLSFTLEGAKGYVVLCLRLRCGMKFTTMATCRVADLELMEAEGRLRAFDKTKRREMIYHIDEETAAAIKNLFSLRDEFSDSDPLIPKSGYHGSEIGGFYKGCNLQQRLSTFCSRCDLKVGDYDINKTAVMLAFAEGADILQATALAATESLALAGRVAEELNGVETMEIKRRFLEGIDSTDDVATGLVKAENIIDIVPIAYRVSSIKVTIGADGWARFEIPELEVREKEA